MAIQKEIWAGDIIDNLYKNNEFATRCLNGDHYVLGGAVVHRPTAGLPSDVKKNLTSFPASATERTDTDQTYPIDAYYALPRRIANLDKYELSYDKRQSVVGEDTRNLVQTAMDGLLYRWASGGTQLLTEGTAVAAEAPSATGTRKAFTKAAFARAAKEFAKNNFHGQELTAVLTATHYYQFLESLSEGEKTAFFAVADMKKGVVGEYMGIKIFIRSTVATYRHSTVEDEDVYTLQDQTAEGWTPNATDCQASIIYAHNAVERALGDVDVFDNPGQALYYGDIFSAMMRFGGKTLRANGCYVVIEAVGS